MRITVQRIIIFLLICLSAGVAAAQTFGPVPPTPSGVLPFTPTQIINPKDPAYGAKIDALLVQLGSTTATSATFTRGDGANFSGADVGKTIVIPGAGTGGNSLSTTLSSVGTTTATLGAAATYTTSTSTSYASQITKVVSAQSGSGNYVPGDTITATGGVCALEPTFTVRHTTVVSANVAAGGSAGTTSTNAVVYGTTGTGMLFRALVTISGGAVTAVNTIQIGGDYRTNVISTNAEPVTGGGLSGATLKVTMGVLEASVTNPGNCTTFPSNPVAQGSTSGNGTGVGLNVTSTAGGSWYYGTDDTVALQAAMTASRQNGTFQNGACVMLPPGSAIISSAITITANDECLIGTSRAASTIYFDDATGTADAFAASGTNGRLTFREISLQSIALKSAGALLHFTDSFDVRVYNSQLGNTFDWNAILVDCSANNPNKIYVQGTQIANVSNDGILTSCPGGTYSIADVYIEKRNYIQNVGYAAIEMQGKVGGTFVVDTTIYANGYGIYADGQGIAGSLGSNTFLNNDIDSDTIFGAYFNGLTSSTFQSNHIFGGGLYCKLCVNIAAGLQHYESTTAYGAFIIEGVTGLTSSGDHFSVTRPYVIQASGATASTDIALVGSDYYSGASALYTFIGPTTPTLRMTMVGQVNASASCISNLGGTANATTPYYICGSVAVMNSFQASGTNDFQAGNVTNGNGFHVVDAGGSVADYFTVKGAQTGGGTVNLGVAGSDGNINTAFNVVGTGGYYFNMGGSGGTGVYVNGQSGGVTGGLQVSPGTGVGGAIILSKIGTGTGGMIINSDGNGPLILEGGSAKFVSVATTGAATLFNQPTTGAITYAVCAAANANGATGGAMILDTSATVCGLVSAKEYKNPVSTIQAQMALVGLEKLRLSTWTFKDKERFDAREHVGLYADDVVKMDPRCGLYENGKPKNYEDRCVLGYLVAVVQRQQIEIAALKVRRSYSRARHRQQAANVRIR